MMETLNRRAFLATSAAAGAATLAALQAKPVIAGANDVIRMGVVGMRGRGVSHIQGFQKLAGVEVVALCDVDEKVLGARADALEKSQQARRSSASPTCAALRRQGDRCDQYRHAQSLAFPGRHLGHAGRQRRLRRETLLAQRLGRPATRQGSPQVQPHVPAWHAGP